MLEGENNWLVVDHLLGKLMFQVLKLNQIFQKSELVVLILIFVFQIFEKEVVGAA